MQVHNVFDSMLYTVKRTGFKALSGLIAVSSLISIFGVMPVCAEESGNTNDLTATISGNTLGNNISSIRSTACEGEQQLSGTDAEVFKKVVPESDGDVVCAKSDGFRTEVTGTSDVKNYHWTAWYLKNKDDKPDTTNDIGNYHGFNASKVTSWKAHADEIKGLNNGAFPEEKDYTYPVDTKENKINFWGDIAGYYNLLGDPQYKAIHLTSYQQFSYKTKHEIVEWVAVPDEGAGGGDNTANNKNNGTNKRGPMIIADPKSHICKGKKKCQKEPDKPKIKKTQQLQGDGNNMNFGLPCDSPVAEWRKCTTITYEEDAPAFIMYNQNDSNISSNELLAKKIKTKSEGPVVEGIEEKNGITMEKHTTYVYTDETQEVKVAEADLSSGVYATEYAAIPRLALKAGSGSTSELKVNNNGFWKTTPRYWTDKGTITVTNKSDMLYHYESELTSGEGVNNVNIYANLNQKDKLFTLIHGYPNITDINITGITGTPSFPSDQDETCVDVDNDAVCSKKQTPLILIEVPLDGDNPQQLEEADKTVHLVKNQETQDAIKDAKNK